MEVTLFKEPVEWPDPVVEFHDGAIQPWGLGIRASTYAAVWRDEMIRKYTRGSCDAHAIATVRQHGGRVLALMQGQYVVHVLSLHHDGNFLITRDVTGDMAWPEDWEFSPEDFSLLAAKYLLSCPIEHIIIGEADPWPLPSRPPECDEISEAGLLSSVTSPVGSRCPEPDEDELVDFSF